MNDPEPAPDKPKSKRYTYIPPLFKTVDDYAPKRIITRYVNLFSRRIIGNPDFAKLSLHCIIGQLPEIKKMRIRYGDNELDMRISGCAFMPLGCHGDTGLDFMAKMCQDLGINYKAEVIAPDRFELAGTTTYTTGYDPSRKGVGMINKIIRGILDPTLEDGRVVPHILSLPKAEQMLETQKDNHRFYEIALKTIDTPGNKIDVEGEKRGKQKGTAVRIEFQPSCSFMFVSQIPKNFHKTLERCDLLQSMILIYNKPTTKDKINMAKGATQLISVANEKDYEYDLIIEALQYINKWWGNPHSQDGIPNYEVEIIIMPVTVDKINEAIESIFKEIRNVDEDKRELLEDYAQGMIKNLWRVAWHHMILRHDTTLKIMDVEYSAGFLLPVWKDVIKLCRKG